MAERLRQLGEATGTRGLGINATTVGRWERGEQRPRPPYPKILCLLFEATAVELGLAPSPYMPPSDTLDEVERRRLLRMLGGALAVPVVARGKAKAAVRDQVERLAHAVARPSGADHAVVSAVEAGIAAARRIDDVSGPRVAVQLALAQREVIRKLLMGGPPPAVQAGLTVASGQLSQFLGWLAHDMNDHPTSLEYLNEALRVAQETGARDLEAYVLGHRSGVELTEARPQQGMAFAETARSWAEAKGSPATRSWLASVEARALARLGDRRGAERAIDQARAALARIRPEDEPPWMYFYDQAELDGMEGFVRLTLGLAEPARRVIQQGIATSEASMVRDRAKRLTRLGQTYVLDREVDEACRLASKALAIASETRSDGTVRMILELRAQLKPWESEAVVRDLDDQLVAASVWCRPFTV